MIIKLLSLLIRGGVVFGFGYLIGFTLHEGFNLKQNIPIVGASIIWISGGLYSLLKFNVPFSVLIQLKNSISVIIDDKNKNKIEESMIRTKKLFDNGILTQDEYDKKIKELKEKYL